MLYTLIIAIQKTIYLIFLNKLKLADMAPNSKNDKFYYLGVLEVSNSFSSQSKQQTRLHRN